MTGSTNASSPPYTHARANLVCGKADYVYQNFTSSLVVSSKLITQRVAKLSSHGPPDPSGDMASR